MVRQVYADGITNVTFTGGMVRIDLASIPAGQPGATAPLPLEVHERVVLTPQAFLRSIRLMEDLMKKMVDAGVYNPVAEPAKPMERKAALRADAVH